MRRLVVFLALLAGVLLAADRLGAVYAADQVARSVARAEALGSPPDVAIHGFPFLTQLVSGSYDDIEITVDDIEPGELRVDELNVHLRGVDVPFADVVSDDVERIPVDRLDGSLRVAFTELSRALEGLQVERAGNDAVRVTGTLDVAGVSTRASGTGQMRLVDRRLAVVIDDVHVDGAPAPAPVAASVRDRFGFSLALPDLPFRVTLEGVRVDATGVVVSVRARDVVLRAAR